MKRTILSSTLLMMLLFSSCSSCDTKTLHPHIQRGKVVATVHAEELVVGQPVTQAQKDQATDMVAMWTELSRLTAEVEGQ